MTLYGWDMSHYDWDRHPVSLADARKAGISFVTHKATEGDGYTDPRFDDYIGQLKTADMPVAGAYMVLNGDIDVTAQVNHHVAVVEAALGGWKHPCWIEQLDCEPLDGHPAPSKAQIIEAAALLRGRMGLLASQIVVYGPHWVYQDKLAPLPYRLWASAYVGGISTFKALYPGDRDSRWDAYSGQVPLVVQYSSNSVIGAQHTCDANAVRVNSEAALRALFIPDDDWDTMDQQQFNEFMHGYVTSDQGKKDLNAAAFLHFNEDRNGHHHPLEEYFTRVPGWEHFYHSDGSPNPVGNPDPKPAGK